MKFSGGVRGGNDEISGGQCHHNIQHLVSALMVWLEMRFNPFGCVSLKNKESGWILVCSSLSWNAEGRAIVALERQREEE